MRSHAAVAEYFVFLAGPEVEDEKIDLLCAALAIARLEYPNLEIKPYLGKVDALAARVQAKIAHPGDEAATITALNQVLFVEEGFRGNTADYYDPRNSLINDVLDRKLGIPITLALVYMEVAARAGFPLFGVGMPGHFLLKHYDPEGRQFVLDPFHQGRLMTPEDCQRQLDQIYGGQMQLAPEMLVSVTRRQMLMRMLANLKTIYLSHRDIRRALPVVDLVLAIYPRSAEDVKQRAVLRYNLGQTRDALADFDTYLKMAPEASDADEIRQTVLAIKRRIALLN
ncbi:MAG TPA: transglutaminase-like domain-containing protein [Terriglobales bacterium]|nr:transglutaminase-like domain-containing protein [Terriglobales bacterium]